MPNMSITPMKNTLLGMPAKAALLTALYLALSVAAVASFNQGLPPALEQLLSLLAAPGLFLILIWTPLLRPFGLVTGEWLSAPSFLGGVLQIALYTALAFLATGLALRLFRRHRNQRGADC